MKIQLLQMQSRRRIRRSQVGGKRRGQKKEKKKNVCYVYVETHLYRHNHHYVLQICVDKKDNYIFKGLELKSIDLHVWKYFVKYKNKNIVTFYMKYTVWAIEWLSKSLTNFLWNTDFSVALRKPFFSYDMPVISTLFLSDKNGSWW